MTMGSDGSRTIVQQLRVRSTITWCGSPMTDISLVEHTAIAGKVQMEINTLPVENDEYRSIMTHRNEQALKAKETKFINGVITSNVLNPGTIGGGFDDFIVSIMITLIHVLVGSCTDEHRKLPELRRAGHRISRLHESLRMSY